MVLYGPVLLLFEIIPSVDSASGTVRAGIIVV